MFKVLSIDGGGIRGVIPAYLLNEIEVATGKPIANQFDLIVGTSTGGIIAIGLTMPDKHGRPKYDAADLLALYEKEGKTIFKRSFWDGLTDVRGIVDELYDHKNLVSILKRLLGKARLKDAIKPLVVTSYDIERREPYFFKSHKAKTSAERDHYLWAAARATSAAPTFFEPILLDDKTTEDSVRRALIDGGVFVNNPSMCGYVEAIDLGAKPDDIMVVSLGTGVNTRQIPYEAAKGWGYIKWAKPIISVMMDGSADAADYHLQLLLPEKAGKRRYFRFDTLLDKALDDLDAAHAANIEALKNEARDILRDQKQDFAKLIALLKAA
jgi:patatin-like phospholipase/acyl hydrolase